MRHLKERLQKAYSKSITESRELNRTEVQQEKDQQDKQEQVEGRLKAMEAENSNKFNMIRQLQVDKEKERT